MLRVICLVSVAWSNLVFAESAKACFHAALMGVHYRLYGDAEGLKESFKNGTTELKYVATAESTVSQLVTYASADGCEIVFAFRGSKEMNDVVADIDLQPDATARYHRGFLSAALAYKREVLDRLEKSGCRDEGGPRVTLTGHSLGGALAQAMANVVLRDKLPQKTKVVAFGAPRFVVQTAALLGQHSDRFPVEHYYISKDPVTNIPPAPLYSELTSTNYRFTEVAPNKSESNIGAALFANHMPNNYVDKMNRLCEGKEGTTLTSGISHGVLDSASTVARKALSEGKKEAVKQAPKIIRYLGAGIAGGATGFGHW